MSDFLENFISGFSILNGLELTAVIAGLFYVGLASIGSRWCFLFGLISSAIYVYICLDANLYFDFAINGYYVVMSFVGWFSWQNAKGNLVEKSITSVKTAQLLKWIGIGILSTFALALAAEKFTDANLPYLDAFTTVFAIIATYMVIQKQLENWLIWIVVDLVATGMYFHKELYFTSVLYFIYTVVALFGYFRWKKQLA